MNKILLLLLVSVFIAAGCGKPRQYPGVLIGIIAGEKRYVGMSLCYKVFAEGVHTYQWDMGDWTTSTEPAPCHVYTATGAYTVKLVLNNNPELVAYKSVTILDTPRYTSIAAGMHNWKYYSGRSFSGDFRDTLYTADTTFAINYIDPVTITVGGDTIVYSQTTPAVDTVLCFYKTTPNGTGHNTSKLLRYVHGSVSGDSITYEIFNQQSAGGAVVATFISK